MLQKPNSTLSAYLERASVEHEKARLATNKDIGSFHHKMSERWMDLAASTALVERIDLYLQSVAFKKLAPIELCYDCNRRMRLITAEVTREGEQHLFECPKCANKVMRERQGSVNESASVHSPRAAKGQ